MKALVVDDEPLARERLAALLADVDGIEVAGEAANGLEALEAAVRVKPDLVLLDIRMPVMDGLEAARHFNALETPPAVIFCTAYQDHALAAFEANAVDYLVKPFSRERFVQTLARAKRRLSADRRDQPDAADVFRALVELRRQQEYVQRIPVPVDEYIKLVDVERIDWIEASRNQVRLHVGADTFELRETMSALEARLDPRRFVRVHRSAIVNVDRISAIHPWFNGYHMVVLTTGKELRMSRYQHESFTKLARLSGRPA